MGMERRWNDWRESIRLMGGVELRSGLSFWRGIGIGRGEGWLGSDN